MKTCCIAALEFLYRVQGARRAFGTSARKEQFVVWSFDVYGRIMTGAYYSNFTDSRFRRASVREFSELCSTLLVNYFSPSVVSQIHKEYEHGYAAVLESVHRARKAPSTHKTFLAKSEQFVEHARQQRDLRNTRH